MNLKVERHPILRSSLFRECPWASRFGFPFLGLRGSDLGILFRGFFQGHLSIRAINRVWVLRVHKVGIKIASHRAECSCVRSFSRLRV